MIKKCNDCYFFGICDDNTICEGYTPLGDEAENASFENLIANQREEFRTEWNKYIILNADNL